MPNGQVFHGERQLAIDASEQFITAVWQKACEQRKPRYLDFVCELVSADGVPIKTNQDRMIKVIKDNYKMLQWKNGWENDTIEQWEELDAATKFEQEQFGGNAHDMKMVNVEKEEERARYIAEFDFHLQFANAASLLCANRHRESIDFFLTNKDFGFTYEYCVERIVDDQLAPNARCTFTRLMNSLYVDREPFETYDDNQKSRMLPKLTAASIGMGPPERADPYNYGDQNDPEVGQPLRMADWSSGQEKRLDEVVAKPSDGFMALKQSTMHVLRDIQKLDANDKDMTLFLTEVLSLAQKMLLFGMYDNAFDPDEHSDGVLKLGPECKMLALMVLRLFDGRNLCLDGKTTATLELGRVAQHSNKNDDPASPRSSAITGKYNDDRFVVNQGNLNLMLLKCKGLGIVETLFGVRASNRVSAMLTNIFPEGGIKKEPFPDMVKDGYVKLFTAFLLFPPSESS